MGGQGRMIGVVVAGYWPERKPLWKVRKTVRALDHWAAIREDSERQAYGQLIRLCEKSEGGSL